MTTYLNPTPTPKAENKIIKAVQSGINPKTPSTSGTRPPTGQMQPRTK
jgi:hypothetical protein